MADVQTQSPEATYATKGNIIPQKAYAGARTGSSIADGLTANDLPNAEQVIEDHLSSAPYPQPGGASQPTITTGSLSAYTTES